MTTEAELLLVLTTVPDQAIGLALARGLISLKLSACVQVLPSMISIYWWQEEIRQEQEHLLLIKALKANYADIQAYLHAHHPYDEPEIMATPVTHASDGYRDWLKN